MHNKNYPEFPSIKESSAPEEIHLSPLKRFMRDWLPVVSLCLAAFIFVSTEFMPIGLLPDMANSFGRTEPEMGLIMTYYAWTVALMALPLTILSARLERKKLLIGLMAIFICGNILVAFSTNFSLLMTARIIIALAHAIFWSIITPLAHRVAPEGKKTQALSLVIAGSSLAMVLGVPLGTAIGHYMSWRVTFGTVSLVALAVLGVIIYMLPRLPSINAGSLKSLPTLLKRPDLTMTYLLTMLIVTGHFIAYTYLTPFYLNVGAFEPQVVVLLLLVLGSAGIVGSLLTGHALGRIPHLMLYLPMLVVGISLLLLNAATSTLWTSVILCFIWGAAMTGSGLVLMTRVLKFAHDAKDVATAIYSGIFNIGIGAGALLGANVYKHLGLNNIGYAGFIFIVIAIVTLLCFRLVLSRSGQSLEN